MFGSVVVRPSEAGLPREFTDWWRRRRRRPGTPLGERMWECLVGAGAVRRDDYEPLLGCHCSGMLDSRLAACLVASREGRSRRFSALPDRRGGQQLAGQTWWRSQSAWPLLAAFWL